MTVDVEDYFQVNAFAKHIKPEDWDSYPLRVEGNTIRILDLFDEHQVKATFFVLGWVADRRPGLVKEIHRRGHEIASHGYGHQLIWNLGPEKFRQDVRLSKKILEDLTGVKVNGYRAPTYSITEKTLWALDILIEEGFTYDSSIFPIRHDVYGIPKAPRFPHVIRRNSGEIKEFPLTTAEIGIGPAKIRIPVAGGGYLRLFPAWFIQRMIHKINQKEGQPAVIYFHPWEIDLEQPRMKATMMSRGRHYMNLKGTMHKVSSLIAAGHFTTLAQALGIK